MLFLDSDVNRVCCVVGVWQWTHSHIHGDGKFLANCHVVRHHLANRRNVSWSEVHRMVPTTDTINWKFTINHSTRLAHQWDGRLHGIHFDRHLGVGLPNNKYSIVEVQERLTHTYLTLPMYYESFRLYIHLCCILLPPFFHILVDNKFFCVVLSILAVIIVILFWNKLYMFRKFLFSNNYLIQILREKNVNDVVI